MYPLKVDFSSNLVLTQAIAANTTSQMITIPETGRNMELQCEGYSGCFVIWGTSNVVATVANSTANGSYYIQAGQSKVVLHKNATKLAAITSSGTANLYITTGDGV